MLYSLVGDLCDLFGKLSPNFHRNDGNEVTGFLKLRENKDGQILAVEYLFSYSEDVLQCMELACIILQLVETVLSPGIILRKKENDIFCILCDEQVSDLFNSEYLDHINNHTHQIKVQQNKNKQKLNNFDSFFENNITKETYDFDYPIRFVNRLSIIVGDDTNYHCIPCNNFKIANLEQLDTHLKEEAHRTWAIDQLDLVTRKTGLEAGITIKDDHFYCELCQHEMGSSLVTTEAYHHLSTEEHKKKKIARSWALEEAYMRWCRKRKEESRRARDSFQCLDHSSDCDREEEPEYLERGYIGVGWDE